MPVRPGDILASKYRVERAIGEGGMGIVVAARHLELDELFAIKFLTAAALSGADAKERFLREARASARLKGQHVAKVHDVGRLETGVPYMVMELLEGTDFKRLLKERGPLPAGEAAAYLLEACEAIAEAHALGIIHRDIKPANLFLADRPIGRPCVKVLDFGISKQRAPEGDDLTQTGSILGSPAYMSPEQMLRTRTVGQRSDIWALGVVLYELVTGVSPFHGDAVTEVVARVLNEDPEPPSRLRPDLPAWVDAVVLRCLKKSPDERFQTVVELAEVLEPHAASGPSRFSGASRRHSAPIARSADGGPTARAAVMPPAATSTSSTWDRTAAQPSRARALHGLFATVAAGGIAAAIGGAVWLLKAPPPGEPDTPVPASGATEVTAPGTSAPPASTAAFVELAPAEQRTASPPASAAPTSLPAAAPKVSAAKPQGKPAVTAKPTSAPKAGEPEKHEGIY